MTDKVNQWIWYVNTDTYKIGRLKLKSFLKKVNHQPHYNRPPQGITKIFFATKELCKQYRGTRQQAKLAKT